MCLQTNAQFQYKFFCNSFYDYFYILYDCILHSNSLEYDSCQLYQIELRTITPIESKAVYTLVAFSGRRQQQ